MPPVRRSARLKRTKAAAAAAASVVERFYTREKKRREINPRRPTRSPSAVRDTKEMSSLFTEDNPLIDEVVQSGAVPRLVEFLKSHDCPQLQCEAARVLKNIAYENTEVVIDSGAVPVFVKLLESSELETCEQVAWSLGNIAGESFSCRDVVLSCGALHPLLTLLEKHDSLSFLRIGIWTLTNMFEGGPKVPFEQLKFSIRIVASLIAAKDEQVLEEACWALLYISHRKGGIETALYEAGLCLELAKLLEHAPLSVLFTALRSIQSIVSGAEKLDKQIIEVNRYLTSIDREDITAQFRKDKRCCKRFLVEMRQIQSWVSFVEWEEYVEKRMSINV